jgi:hypothetical protein
MGLSITKHHIGAEIISILTKGMYPDPKDALREYIQNGVDADANNIEVKIRGNSIVIADDGSGMNEETMKNAIRIGISDKDPRSDVGFRGIGIYSAFHLCDKLNIYSRVKDNIPHVLTFNFAGMRETLNQQQEDRLKGKINGDDLIDLQSIMRDNIDVKPLKEKDFPITGTRVEMIGAGVSFFKSLSRFEEVATYLRQVVPLHFDKSAFKWADRIEKKIHEICKKYKATFRVVNLELQVDSKKENLYRPYKDALFQDKDVLFPDGDCLAPVFKEIKSKDHFWGVAWGCLNKARRKIADTDLRGFLLMKQGFALGKRSDMARHFGKRTTYFDRYAGEIIVVNADLLPNAARTDFETSPLRTSFHEALAGVASEFNAAADKHQEYTLGDEQIDEAIEVVKEKESTITFNYDRTDQLLDDLVEVRLLRQNLENRIKRDSVRPDRIKEASEVVKSARSIEKEIQNFVESRNERSNKTKNTPEYRSQKRIAKLPATTHGEEPQKKVESLAEILERLDLNLTKEMKRVIDIIDERFIQGSSDSRSEYLILLKDFAKELEESISEGK